MAKTFRRSSPEAFEEPAINLTPLIDVVFVILIGFIMIAPLLELDRVELADAPQASAHQSIAVQETSPIAVHVRQDNTILFGSRPVTLPQLIELLKEAKNRHPKTTPQLFHDKKGYFGTYQSVKNAFEEAGFDQVDVILKPS